ncbi:hypothetical protein RN001_012602 [Aquatica leii]|uniref:E3 ubiquitin-protein ligase RNF10 n=1 Tax=Aquatica leii TaxID=1421715 RepID=A0AAN7SPJ9_9COLE|nr:hypothetical protein RN001_012602 [Aquatica leii]
MEKKGSRLVQPLQKGLGTDSKKSQDANKVWPRGCRRREPNGGTFSKNETSRKPNTQRNKTIDKRPRPRGYYYSGSMGGTEEPGVDQQDAELGSVFLQGSKKQSLNHLLNFHFESRESNQSVSGYRWNSAIKHKYNKEQFLQANCQFVVQKSGDYKQYMNNPDALVNWDLIEQVNIHVLEFPSCPVCLYPPVAAKMTRCGHIYCWSCILHYLALSDKAWRKCPICYESVHKNDLKSVISIPHGPLQIHDTITFKLMKRLRGSLIAYPADLEIHDQNVPYNVSDKITSEIYSKLLLADTREVHSIIERERSELLHQLAEDENCPEKCFIEQALILVQGRAESVLALSNELTEDVRCFKNDIRQRFESVGSDNLCEDADIFTVEDLDKSTTTCSKQPLSKYFYFYQASDGQHIYMHSLNIRMLEHTYGGLEYCPEVVTGRILEKESGSVTEELRKRQRYMQHLPVTCQFELAEIYLKPPIVKPETLEQFREQIEMRQRRRQRRNREEKRREKRIVEEENKKMGKYAEANIQLESQYQFPDFQTAMLLEETGRLTPESERSASPISNKTEHSQPGSFKENEGSAISFAKMLSSKNVTAPVWPVRKNTNIVAAKSPKIEESNEYVAPIHNQSFGDVIALALEKATLNDNGNSKGGKKKKQKKILFSTSMTFNNNERV